MRPGYTMRGFAVRCLAGLWQPSADRPVHEDAKHHQVIQQEDKDESSGDRVSHAPPLPQQEYREQTNFQTTKSPLKFIDCRGKVQEPSGRSDYKLLHSLDLQGIGVRFAGRAAACNHEQETCTVGRCRAFRWKERCNFFRNAVSPGGQLVPCVAGSPPVRLGWSVEPALGPAGSGADPFAAPGQALKFALEFTCSRRTARWKTLRGFQIRPA